MNPQDSALSNRNGSGFASPPPVRACARASDQAASAEPLIP